MIKLTETYKDNFGTVAYERPIYIPDNAVVKPWNNGLSKVIVPNCGEFIVSESHEQVVRKIMEYKLAMVRYGAAMYANDYMNAADRHEELDILAGLEESPDAQ